MLASRVYLSWSKTETGTGWWRCVLLVPRNFPVHTKPNKKYTPRFENYEFILDHPGPALVLVLVVPNCIDIYFIASGYE